MLPGFASCLSLPLLARAPPSHPASCRTSGLSPEPPSLLCIFYRSPDFYYDLYPGRAKWTYLPQTFQLQPHLFVSHGLPSSPISFHIIVHLIPASVASLQVLKTKQNKQKPKIFPSSMALPRCLQTHKLSPPIRSSAGLTPHPVGGILTALSKSSRCLPPHPTSQLFYSFLCTDL